MINNLLGAHIFIGKWTPLEFKKLVNSLYMYMSTPDEKNKLEIMNYIGKIVVYNSHGMEIKKIINFGCKNMDQNPILHGPPLPIYEFKIIRGRV